MTKRITVRIHDYNFRAMEDERLETGRSFSAQVNEAIFKRWMDRIMRENEQAWKGMTATPEMGPPPPPSLMPEPEMYPDLGRTIFKGIAHGLILSVLIVGGVFAYKWFVS